MEVLSPRSANIPVRQKSTMKKPATTTRPKPEEKPSNPDRIDDKWRPPVTVTEPGDVAETYVVGKKLGKGGFAVCFEGQTKSTAQVFALKVVKAEVQQKKMMEKFRTEMQIHAKMQHPNIVEFYRAFSLQGHTYVVLELCNNGSLTDMVRARGCLSLPEVRRFTIQICGGVKYMHKRSVIHRDLKMGNIFIDARMNLKIGDFGLAAVMADDQDRRTTLCGTPNYIAPEILSKSGTRGHDYKVDTWAIGVICYAMLMGTPPFQSKTQAEIYTKLKTLEYEWKIDSINYIPQEAKDFVAACLNLVAADRPDMDELVQFPFFTMGSIADSLDESCLKSKPNWLENADPRGDRVRKGYGVSHSVICTDCGVGKTSDGRLRPAVGGKAKISTLMEIEVENRQGTAPTTPLPEGILYKRMVEADIDLAKLQAGSLPSRPRSRKPLDEPSTDPHTSTTQSLTKTETMSTYAMLPPRAPLSRPAQSFAAQQRQQALPRQVIGRFAAVNDDLHSSVKSVVQTAVRPDSRDDPVEPQGYFSAKPVRAGTSRKPALPVETHPTTISKSSTCAGGAKEISDRLMRETDDAMHRPRSTTIRTLPTRTRSLRSRGEAAATKISTETMTDAPLRAMTENIRELRASNRRPLSRADDVDKHTPPLTSNSEPARQFSPFQPRLIDDAESYSLVPNTSHGKILRSLNAMFDTLSIPFAAGMGALGSSATPTPSKPHPRVEKWVDYATKHGIAYILTDGTLGMIRKSRKEESASSGCIIVRDARQHTVDRAKGTEQQFVPQGNDLADIEFYEQVDPIYAMKKLDVVPHQFRLDLEKYPDQMTAANALVHGMRGSRLQRLKEVGLLDKFGKYMHKQMGASEPSDVDTECQSSNGHLIHFYQRMGNVGIWRFVQGSLQFNFPDHTKLVLYQINPSSTELMVDVVHLEPRDAKDLSTHGCLTMEALERRGSRTFRLRDIQENLLRRAESEIVRTNEIREKLSWILAVIGCWIKEGGLGWIGERELGWSGMQEKRDDKRIKLQWITVGRPGGDDGEPNRKP